MCDVSAADREQLESMVEDWLADNAGTDETEGLVVDWDDVHNNDGRLVMGAHDRKYTYTLCDDGTGNIRLDYCGTM